MFLTDIKAFSSLPVPFTGTVRIFTPQYNGFYVVGLRSRYNERGEFLFTTTPPANQSTYISTPSPTDLLFPHFADGGGFTTQFVLYGNTSNAAASGTIEFSGQNGQTLSLGLK